MRKIILMFAILMLVACRPQPEVPPQPVMQPPQPVVEAPPVATTPPSMEDLPPPPAIETQAGPSTVNVDIKDFSFQPSTVNIKAGDTVVWTQRDSVVHTATSVSGPESFDSGPLAQDQSFSYTFTKPGAYSYKCTPHPNMRGTVVVG